MMMIARTDFLRPPINTSTAKELPILNQDNDPNKKSWSKKGG